MSVTWRICAISAALSRRVMMMAGRKVMPMDEKKDEKKDELRDELKVVPKEPKMRRRPQPVVFLQWACLPSKWQQQPSCH